MSAKCHHRLRNALVDRSWLVQHTCQDLGLGWWLQPASFAVPCVYSFQQCMTDPCFLSCNFPCFDYLYPTSWSFLLEQTRSHSHYLYFIHTGAFRKTAGSIRSKKDSSKCLDVNPVTANTKVQIWSCNNGVNQNKFVRPAANSLQLKFGTLCLGVNAGASTNGAAVTVQTCSSTANHQKWFFDKEGRLRPWNAVGRCLDIPNANVANGVKLQIWDCHTGANQKWTAV